MPTRRHYDARTKARAVGIALVEGPTAAGRKTGIPKQTIDYWTDDPLFGQFRTRARDDVTTELWAGFQVGVRALVDGMRDENVPLRDKAQAFTALAQNMLLLTGQATSRTESGEITTHLDDHEVEQLTALLDEERQRRADSLV